LYSLQKDLGSFLVLYHENDTQNLETKQEIERQQMEFIFEKILTMFVHGGFIKFNPTAEPSLNEILDREEKMTLELTQKAAEARSNKEAYIIVEKDGVFNCVFDNIYKFAYNYEEVGTKGNN